MTNDFDNGVLYIGDHRILFSDLIEILDMIKGLEETEIVDVDVNGDDVICTFANGETQTAHCHPDDSWSLETGISVCLGKYLTGGSSEYNRIVRHGVKIFKNKMLQEAKAIEDRIEKERIRENKRLKHERYLKRRAKRQAMERNESEGMGIALLNLLNDFIKDLGVEIDLTVN